MAISIAPRIPTTPAAPSRRAASARHATPSPALWSIALLGSVVAFLSSMAGSYAHYLAHRPTDEYAGLVIVLGAVVGVIALAPGALLSALSARTFRWRSPRAMWTAGVVGGALGPLLLWLAFLVAS